MPAFPLHGWMPDGYRAMPMPVLAVFSGVLSKVAAYGFLRICCRCSPTRPRTSRTLMLLIALASILYGSAMAFTTTDARLILGYSSVAQLGLHHARDLRPAAAQGAQGAMLQSVNHGLVVAPAFFIVALLAARAGGSEDIRDMGGIAFRAPVLATLFLIVALANLAMPGSSNFVGEFLILLGVFNAKIVIAIVAFTGVALASVYTLRLFIRTMHNRVGPDVESREMTLADGLVLVPLVAVILFLALYPQFALKRSERSVTAADARRRALARARRCTRDRDAVAKAPAHRLGRRCRRCWRCSAARRSCCCVGLLRPRFVREALVPAPGARRARRRDRAGASGSGTTARTSSPGALRLDGLRSC